MGALTKAGHLANLALLAALTAWGRLSWDRIPFRIPVHFGADGQPNRWTGKTPAAFFLFFGLPWVFTAVLYAINGLTRWLRKPPELIRAMDQLMVAMAFSLNVLFTVVAYYAVQVATGTTGRLPPGPFLGALGLVFATALAGAIALPTRRRPQAPGP